jgi:hypothetical protein
MPLHDWTDRENWDGFHQLWIVEMLRWVKPRLPAPYRAYVGTVPALAVGGASGKPDLSVRGPVGEARPPAVPPTNGPGAPSPGAAAPLFEVAVASLESAPALYVECRGFLVAAVELISPRNKDRPSSREGSVNRYAAYLRQHVNLLLVDVFRRPIGFAFPEYIAADLGFEQPPCPAPCAIGYRVGDMAATGGRLLAVWPYALTIGAPLPTVVLPLNIEESVPIDLEYTYMRAADNAYLE